MTVNPIRRKLAVLHVATINHPIRPDLSYAPIETVIHNIDKGLHSQGHRSIVACSGDSVVSGEHFKTVERSIGGYCNDKSADSHRKMEMHQSRALFRALRGDIDVIHMHDSDAVELMHDYACRLNVPIIMTLHVAARESSLQGAYQRWCNPLSSPLVYCAAISRYQKEQYSSLLNTSTVIHHGVDVGEFPAKDAPDREGYLFSIGRITPDKGQDKAIEVAKRTGSRLVIAGCVQNKEADREFFAGIRGSMDLSVEGGRYPADENYYGRMIKPLMDSGKQIIYIGEISSAHAKLWYRHARATLFPIQWGEPFGLVLIESMACGTPVIAFNEGSVPEIVAHGRTGLVVSTMDEMAAAVGRIGQMDPAECRRHVQENFSITRMAGRYSALYHQAILEHERIVQPRTSLGQSAPGAAISNAQAPGAACQKTYL